MNIDPYLRRLVSRALKEDLDGRGDITTRWFLPTRARYRARVTFKADGVLCGSAIAGEVFRQACPGARVRWLKRDGNRVRAGTVVARIEGPREIMTAERTALNFLQHLSGIATLASRYAAEARGTRARIYDTRKTLPGWRTLAKYAVRAGGGRNHRMGLYDMVLLKDNHLAGWAEGGIGIEEIRRRLRKFRRRHPRTAVQIEVASRSELDRALALRPELVLLDNMGPAALKAAIRRIRERSPRTLIEISGGVDLGDVRRLARLGPDRISVGRITHSVPAVDISMKLE